MSSSTCTGPRRLRAIHLHTIAYTQPLSSSQFNSHKAELTSNLCFLPEAVFTLHLSQWIIGRRPPPSSPPGLHLYIGRAPGTNVTHSATSEAFCLFWGCCSRAFAFDATFKKYSPGLQDGNFCNHDNEARRLAIAKRVTQLVFHSKIGLKVINRHY